MWRTRADGSRDAVTIRELLPDVVRLDMCFRHPSNRVPTDDAVAMIASDLKARGQLHPGHVRKLPNGFYQILSGETRWRAAKLNGEMFWDVVWFECDDDTALAHMTAENAKRRDLTTIEKARVIKTLRDCGFSLAEAAAEVSLESASAASNLVKLLDAPEEWQRALAEGMKCGRDTLTIHEATVREMAKYACCPKFQAAVTEHFRRHAGSYAFTRDQQLRAISIAVNKVCRPVKGKQHYGWQYGDHPCYLDLTNEALRVILDIVEVPLGAKGAMIEVSLNPELWDKQQISEIKKRGLDRESQLAGKKSPKNGGGDKAKLSPKEQAAADKAKRKEQDEQLERWVVDWAHRFLRCSMAGLIDSANDARWLLPWLVSQAARDYRCPLGALMDYAAFSGTSRFPKLTIDVNDSVETSSNMADVILQVRGSTSDGQISRASKASELSYRFARLILWPCDPSTEDEETVAQGIPEKLPILSHKETERFAESLGVTIAQAWKDAAKLCTDERVMVHQLFARHTSDQLDDLAEELGVTLDAKGKAARVDQLLDHHLDDAPLPLPKVVSRLLTPAKRKKGGAA